MSLTLVAGLCCLAAPVWTADPVRPTTSEQPGTALKARGLLEADRDLGRVAANSRLPYPTDAEVWVDAAGTLGDAASRIGLLVYRTPRQSSLAQVVAYLFVAGVLPDKGRPLWQGVVLAKSTQTIAEQRSETRVYRIGPDEGIVAGVLTELPSQQQSTFVVRVAGRFEALGAATEATRLVSVHLREARTRRNTVPTPAGSTPIAPEVRLDGAGLQELRTWVADTNQLSDVVKAQARDTLARATSVRRTVWRTTRVLTDAEFFAFYDRQAEQLGWGTALVKDQTVRQQPAAMYRLNGGVVLIKAAPAAGGSLNGRLVLPGTNISVLEIREPTSPAESAAPASKQ